MDQHSHDSLPSVELPSPEIQQPSPEALSPDIYNEQESSKQTEPAPQNIQDPPSQPTQHQPIPPAPTIQPHDAPAAGTVGVALTPQIADDTDLIEKEWVERAKRIVEHTKHDPHQQTKEMNAMKADYLKKRYNKDIKTSD